MLGIWTLTFYGIAASIGSAELTTNGVASELAGTSMFLAWVVSGIAILFTTFIFAELSTKIPKSGSSYRYAYVIAGEF